VYVCNPSSGEAETVFTSLRPARAKYSEFETLSQENKTSQALVAHTCNPSYPGGGDQED
jgi:hypothetical protein